MKSALWFWITLVGFLSLASSIMLFALPAHAAEAGAAAPILGADPASVRWAFISAAAATGMSSVAAALAVARVGSAAVGTLAEKPELFGRLLVLVGLAEGIAIYGLIISILILNQLG
jgi:V/A-type H+-transporting ATPase subunit K